MPTDLEQKARELLAAEYGNIRDHDYAGWILQGKKDSSHAPALRAIAAALQAQQADVVNLLRYLAARISYGTGELVHPDELPAVRGFHRSVWEAADALEAEHHRLVLVATNGDSTASPEVQQPGAQAVATAKCPKCKAPCTTEVHQRSGDWGWGTSDADRTQFHYAGPQPPTRVTDELIDEAVNCAWHVAGTTLHSREDIKAAVKAIYPMFVGTFIRTPAQPPSIPEPSESDVTEAAMTMCDAWCYAPRGTPDWNLHWNFNDPKYMTQARAAITTYTARLRERIGGEG
jgi:hypothetical protein